MLTDNRIPKDQYYLELARVASMRSTCIRRCYGAVLVKDDAVISTGYNGAPRGFRNCNQIGECVREKLNIPAGQRYELCRSVHAEANAIMAATPAQRDKAVLYLYGRLYDTEGPLEKSTCCDMCKRLIINSGISYIKTYEGDQINTIRVFDWVMEDLGCIKKPD